MRILRGVLAFFLITATYLVLTGCRGLKGDPLDPAMAAELRGNVNHIVFMAQENRSFDHYFGQLRQYRAANGYGAASDVDGLPPSATNPDLDGNPLKSYHLDTTCVEELSPGWKESHVDVNMNDPGSSRR